MPVGEYLNRPGYNIHEDDDGDDDYYKDDDADDCDEDVLGSTASKYSSISVYNFLL